MGVVSRPELNGQRVHVAGGGDRGRVRVRSFDAREDIPAKRDCLSDPVDLRGEAVPGEKLEGEEQQHTEEEEERAETPTVEERQQAATTQTKRAPKTARCSTAR